MDTVLKIFLSMSFSGSLLILILFLGKRFLKDKVSRQWQYYIWLIVILRLLLPFGPETNLTGNTWQAIDQAITHTEALTTVHPSQDIVSLLTEHIWLIWLGTALGILIRKVTIYQSFIQYLNAGSTPVSDIDILDRLSVTAEKAGVKKPIELCLNPLVSSPMLIGFFHPCIVLPGINISGIVLPGISVSENSFRYIVLHELTHYKRRDMFYKWLVQITVCLHWFNPLVYLMSREITRACEFSCDEAVLAKMGYGNAQEYGKTLLDAMAAVGKYKESLGSVTLNENKQLLKERLGAIMSFKKKSKAIRILTCVLTLGVILGASFIGVYSVTAASNRDRTIPDKSPVSDVNKKGTLSSQKEQKLERESKQKLDGRPDDVFHDKLSVNSSLKEEEDTEQIDIPYLVGLTEDEAKDELSKNGFAYYEEPQPDVVHYIVDDGTAIYDNDPIAYEPQLDDDYLNGFTDGSDRQEPIISAEPYKGNVD